MLQRQGIRRSYISTVAIPAFVTCSVTGFVLPSVAAMSAPDDDMLMAWATACGRMRCVGTLDGEPDRPPRHHVHAADPGTGGHLESARAMKEAAN
jgi:hypothetical protein